MLYSLFPIILMTTVAAFLAAVLRKPFSALLAPVLFAVIVSLYSFYIFDRLALGTAVTTVMLCAVILCCTACLLFSRSCIRLRHTVCSPTFLLFLAALAFYHLFAAGKIVNLWDSLRLWGAYPKVLHSTGALQLGSSSVLYPSMQSYPPGMPLLCYYITSFSPVFPESSLYVCYSVFGCSMLLPLLEGADRLGKKARHAAFVGILFIPWLLSSGNSDGAQYYSSLFIDIPLGICAGYTLFLAIRGSGGSILGDLRFGLACACLALLKDSGSFISLCCILGAAVSYILHKRRYSLAKRITQVIVPLLFLAYAWGSWVILRDLHSISNHLQLTLGLPSVGEIARIAYRALVTPAAAPLFPFGAIGISLPAALLSIFVLKFLLCRCWQRELIRLELADIGTQILCYGGFYIGYCLIFIEEIRLGVYPSYSRYMSTILISALYIFAADCIFRYSRTISGLDQHLRAVAMETSPGGAFLRCLHKFGRLCVLASLIMGTAMTMVNRQGSGGALYASARKTAAAVSHAIAETRDEAYTDVFLITPGNGENSSRLRHRIYFELIDEGIRVINFYDERDITSPELGYDPDALIAQLIEEGYDYVVLTQTDGELRKRFGALFPDDGTDLIYRLDQSSASLVLVSKGPD